MRPFLLLAAISIGAFLAVDQLAYEGRYRQAAWQEARHQGQRFNNEIRYWFGRFGVK